MSKEFNEWFHDEYDGVKPYEAEPFDKEEIEEAFAAGRALGKREMNEGAVKTAKHGVLNYDICKNLSVTVVRELVANAIEAIPEEG